MKAAAPLETKQARRSRTKQFTCEIFKMEKGGIVDEELPAVSPVTLQVCVL